MNDESARPLSAAEIDLASIAVRDAPDALLLDLMLLAERPIPASVGLLVNGMVVIGNVVAPEHMADRIDSNNRMVANLAEKPDDLSEDEWADTIERFGTAARSGLMQRRQALEQLEQEVSELGKGPDVGVSEVPAELGRRLLSADARSHLTLSEVRIVAPGVRAPTLLPALRVALRHVAAWWLLLPDAEGRSEVSLWSGEAQ